jgi:hypothetical protein
MAIEKNINQVASLLELIKKGDPKTLKKLYEENRKPSLVGPINFINVTRKIPSKFFKKLLQFFIST